MYKFCLHFVYILSLFFLSILHASRCEMLLYIYFPFEKYPANLLTPQRAFWSVEHFQSFSASRSPLLLSCTPVNVSEPSRMVENTFLIDIYILLYGCVPFYPTIFVFPLLLLLPMMLTLLASESSSTSICICAVPFCAAPVCFYYYRTSVYAIRISQALLYFAILLMAETPSSTHFHVHLD